MVTVGTNAAASLLKKNGSGGKCEEAACRLKSLDCFGYRDGRVSDEAPETRRPVRARGEAIRVSHRRDTYL